MPAADEPNLQALADALWDGIRHEPPLPVADAGWRRWYLEHVYAPVVRQRRERIWAHRNPQPWLSAQWLLIRASGASATLEDLRFEGFPGSHSYQSAYDDVRAGRFTRPYLFVAGYSRTGTTSVQDVVMTAFPDHLQPGRWNDAGHPLRLWWYPKHNAATTARVIECGSSVARVLVTVRHVVPTLASHAIYRGYWRPEDLPRDWIEDEAASWAEMTRLALCPTVVGVDFRGLATQEPCDLVAALTDRIGITPSSTLVDVDWTALGSRGISPDVLDDYQVSNLPNQQRGQALALMSDHIRAVLGDRLASLDALTEGALDRAVLSKSGLNRLT